MFSREFRQDFSWVLSLFGTAVGAGVLYLPIQAAAGGLWVLIVASVIIFPLTYLAHSNLTRLVAASPQGGDFTEVVEHYLGRRMGLLVTALYFIAILSILLVYAIGITNAAQSFIHYQLQGALFPRFWLSIILIVAVVSIVLLGERILLRVSGILVYPLMAVLLLIAFYLIPYWHPQQLLHPQSAGEYTHHFLFLLPLLVFAMNFSPICSSFAQSYRKKFNDPVACVKKTDRIIFINVIVMCVFVLFFVYSVALCLSPEQISQALSHNLSAMTIFGHFSHVGVVAFLGPCTTIVAIITSLFGHFMGAREGLNGFFIKMMRWRAPERDINVRRVDIITVVCIVFLLWWAAVMNWHVVTIIGDLVAPVLAVILYILPAWTIRKVPELQEYRRPSDYFMIIIGFLIIVGYVIGQWLI